MCLLVVDFHLNMSIKKYYKLLLFTLFKQTLLRNVIFINWFNFLLCIRVNMIL